MSETEDSYWDSLEEKEKAKNSPPAEEAEVAESIPVPVEKAPQPSNSQNSEKDKEYKCRFCGLSYNYMMTLKAHERVHDVEEPYVCAKCNESFRFYSEYEYHLRTHTNEKGYKCKCGRVFFRYTDMIHHVCKEVDGIEAVELALHPEEGDLKLKHPLKISAERFKPYICQYCGKSYSNSSDLKSHMYGHRGERSFNVRSSRFNMSREPQINRTYTYADFG